MKIGIDYVGITTSFYCHEGTGKFLLQRSEKCHDEHHRWDPGSGKAMISAGRNLRTRYLIQKSDSSLLKILICLFSDKDEKYILRFSDFARNP